MGFITYLDKMDSDELIITSILIFILIIFVSFVMSLLFYNIGISIGFNCGVDFTTLNTSMNSLEYMRSCK